VTTDAVPGARKAALAFILITVFIDILSFGLIIPVLPHLVQDFVGGDTIQAAYWIAIFGVLFSAIQFVCSPLQGALSDRFGRRPVVLLSCLGLGIDFLFMAMAQSLPWLLVGRIISAVFAASFTTANAYIADVTPPEKRAHAFGLLGASFGLGFIVAPAIGGALSTIDIRVPFWFAAGLSLLNFVYGLFVLPESLPKERRSPRFDYLHANPLGSVKLIAKYPAIWGLVAVVFLLNLAHYVYPSIFVLFADFAFGWNAQTVGFVLMVVGVFSVLVNAVLVKKAVKKFGERRTLMLGLTCGMVGFAIYGFAPSGMWFLAGMPIMALWALAMPPAQSMVTKATPPEMQGRIQGALTSLASLAGIAGTMIYPLVFATFIGDHAPAKLPGAPFLLAGMLLGTAALVAWRYAKTHAHVGEVAIASPANAGEG
jgi:DHA1 family tetracycline resistance protein-like MFS transporter